MIHPISTLTRRRLIQFGAGGYLGLNLGGLWQAHAASATRENGLPPIKACILVFYYGGPSHIDTYDLKPHAPAEIRGEFQPISTSVPGLQIGEHLPRMARVMHKVALVRSVYHAAHLHDAASIHALTGRALDGPDRELFAPLPQFYPSFGSAVAHLSPQPARDVPFASLPFVFNNVVPTPCQGGGFLGTACDPLRVEVDPGSRKYQIEMLRPAEGLHRARMQERRGLLETLDVSTLGLNPLSPFYERAYRLLESELIHKALDITQEPPGLRERYGYGEGTEMGYASAMRGQNLLLARRLVEAGVPFVNVYDYKQQGQNWDAHANGAVQHKTQLLPPADRALSALIEDLDARGLLDSTLIVATGEFGRTPKINGSAGRDHWPECYTVLLAGGGVRGGAVYGSSDSQGAFPATDPVTPGDLAATIFWRFGLDPAHEIVDQTGRPHRLASGEPLLKLFGAA